LPPRCSEELVEVRDKLSEIESVSLWGMIVADDLL